MRAPRTHRRRRLLLRPPAPQQQHQAAGGQAAAPPPQLHRARSGAPGPALRRGHSPAGQRGSLQAAPTGRPDASARPSAALARFSRLKSSRDYSIPPLRGRARRAVWDTLLLPPLPETATIPPPALPSGAAVLSAPGAGTASPRPAPPPGGQRDPGLFSAAEVAGAGGWKGELLPVPGRPSGGAGGGRGARWAQSRPIRPRSGATLTAGTAQTSCPGTL